MIRKPDPKHIEKLQTAITRLLAVESHAIGDFIRSPVYEQHTFQGIYAVTTPDDTEIVYIGKTNDGIVESGLADRLWGHAERGSELQRVLSVDRDSLKRHRVRALRLDDPIQRGLTELFGIAIFQPRANRVARLQALPSYDVPEPPAASVG